MFRCFVCGEPVNANRLEDCDYVSSGQPVCSEVCRRMAYEIEKERYELPLRLNPG